MVYLRETVTCQVANPVFCIHFEFLSVASWHGPEMECMFVCVCMCAHLSVCWPSMCACGFICHMPTALWNRGTIIHSSGLQHQCLPVSLIYSLIYTSDTSSPPSQNPCWHETGTTAINLQMLRCCWVPLVNMFLVLKAKLLIWWAVERQIDGREVGKEVNL